jgi:hypothetical protein
VGDGPHGRSNGRSRLPPDGLSADSGLGDSKEDGGSILGAALVEHEARRLGDFCGGDDAVQSISSRARARGMFGGTERACTVRRDADRHSGLRAR